MEDINAFLEKQKIQTLRPAQQKALDSGVIKGKNMLICTPTASGKTLVAEFAILKQIKNKKKAVYVVPLKALAQEKYKEFKKRHDFKTALSIGDLDESDTKLGEYDLIIATAEKLDSILRHNVPWINKVGLLIIDEIHLMNDPGRGPTLEILITLFRRLIKPQILGLSATIGNPQELADWLEAELVLDDWRPVRLDKGIYFDEKVEFPE